MCCVGTVKVLSVSFREENMRGYCPECAGYHSDPIVEDPSIVDELATPNKYSHLGEFPLTPIRCPHSGGGPFGPRTGSSLD